MSATLEDVKKPISPKRAAAELEEVLSKSLFLTPEDSDFDGSVSLNESDISRDSAFDWPHPERFRLAPRHSSAPRLPPQRLVRSHSSSSTSSMEDLPTDNSGWPHPPAATRSKSLGSATSSEIQQKIRGKSLIDDDSATATSSAVASSASGGKGERLTTFISNIGDVNKKDTSFEASRSIGSRKSKRSRQSRKSAKSTRSRKRGDSLEREISLTILQTAEKGADSAHFLVNSEPVVKSPVKSAEEILGDLFVSQDVSLEPITVEEGATKFRAFFADDEPHQLSPTTQTLFADEQLSPVSELAQELSPSAEDALIATKNSKDSGSIFTFHPDDEVDDEDSEKGPGYVKNYINTRPEEAKRQVSAIIAEAPSADSLFAFSEASEVTEDTVRGKEILFHEDALKEEFPNGSRWSPPLPKSDVLQQEKEQPVKSPRLTLTARPDFNNLSVDDLDADQNVLRTNSSADESTDRYKIEMESSISVGASRAFVSASDGASEVQQALAAVASPAISENDFEVNLEREDSFANDEKIAQEEYFLDKLVDIVQVARERPRDVQLSEFYNSESAETESTSTVEYPEDEDELASLSGHNDENQNSDLLPRIESQEKIDDGAHPDPELDDFLEEHGFGEDSDSDKEDVSKGEVDDEWTAFDSSPFGVSRFANDEASGSTAPPPAEGEHSPESPTSITGFSSGSSAREKSKIIWWNREQPADDADVLSI